MLGRTSSSIGASIGISRATRQRLQVSARLVVDAPGHDHATVRVPDAHPDAERRRLAQVLAEIEADAVDRDVAVGPRRLAEQPGDVDDEGVPGGRRHPATGSTGSSSASAAATGSGSSRT